MTIGEIKAGGVFAFHEGGRQYTVKKQSSTYTLFASVADDKKWHSIAPFTSVFEVTKPAKTSKQNKKA